MRDDDDAISRDMAMSESGNRGLSKEFAPTGEHVYSTFNPKTKAGAKMLIAATMGSPKQVEEMVGKTLLVSDYYAHEVQSEKEGGLLETWIRIVIFDNDGTAYQCGSLGVRKSLATIAQIRGRGTLNPPVKVTVRQKRTDNKNLFMWLEPDVDDMLAGLPG